MCSWQNSQGFAESYQEALTTEAWNWFFLLLKPKWYVDNELIGWINEWIGPLDLGSVL